MRSVKQAKFDIQVVDAVYQISEMIRDFFYCQMLKPDANLKEIYESKKAHRDLIQMRVIWN
jgi:hypothetical protein